MSPFQTRSENTPHISSFKHIVMAWLYGKQYSKTVDFRSPDVGNGYAPDFSQVKVYFEKRFFGILAGC